MCALRIKSPVIAEQSAHAGICSAWFNTSLKEKNMKKFAVVAGVSLLALGSIGSAEAQRFNRDGGFRHGDRGERTAWRRHNDGYRYGAGGALAAGFVGGALLGGIATAAAAPYYGYSYPYGYAEPSYGYGYGYPVASYYGDDYYYGAPAYQTRVVYQQPTVRTRVVYRNAPTVRRTRVVYRQAPTARQRVVYSQPRARIVAQPAYNTRVTFRQANSNRVVVRNNVRRDVVSTGSINRRDLRLQRQMMRD